MYDWLFVIVTVAISFYGFTYRDQTGENDFVRHLFGCKALILCFTDFNSQHI